MYVGHFKFSVMQNLTWPKTAEKRRSLNRHNGRTDGLTDQWMDKPSYRDAFLTDSSKSAERAKCYGSTNGTTTQQTVEYADRHSRYM